MFTFKHNVLINMALFVIYNSIQVKNVKLGAFIAVLCVNILTHDLSILR